ncbi:hypothetical protein D9M72_610310 [compost metagenome]
MLGLQRFAQKRIIEQVDLPDREIVGGPPIAVDEGEFASGERLRAGLLTRLFHKSAPVSAECVQTSARGRAGHALDQLLERKVSASLAITCSSSIGMT